jgi:uncharacterized protein (DUF305 family)
METMRGWLRSWNQPLTSTAHPDAHAAHGGLPATGEKEVAALASTPAGEFDKAFLNMFVGHQHNAVELARMEIQGGENFKAKELAKRTDEAVRAQIQHMLRLVA